MTRHIEQLVTLAPVKQEDLPIIKQELHEAFLKGLQDSFPEEKDPTVIGPIPSDDDFHHALTAEDSVVRQLVLDGERIGGVVLKINTDTQLNEVHFLYTKANAHGNGLGTKAWEAIELAFPDTKVWELHTPYFEKRNIHFYINKCGFKIVEFYRKGIPSPSLPDEEPGADEEEFEFFRFEKVME